MIYTSSTFLMYTSRFLVFFSVLILSCVTKRYRLFFLSSKIRIQVLKSSKQSSKKNNERFEFEALIVQEHSCLYPGDLFPFTRRPTFLVVDSDNSLAFASIPHYFDMPLVVLMSPQDVPATFQGKANSLRHFFFVKFAT